MRFHWTLPTESMDINEWVHFAQCAEEAGVESLLIAGDRYDPFAVSCALGQATSRLKFIAGCRPGRMQPTSFVQQVNTLSAFIGGRVALSFDGGGDTAELEEYLAACNAFWRGGEEVDFDGKYYRIEKGKLNTPFIAPDRKAPEIYVSGSQRLAIEQGTCWVCDAETPEALQRSVASARAEGIDVCVRLSDLSILPAYGEIGVTGVILPGGHEVRQVA